MVEIDESLFVKVKHNKGKDLGRPQIWVFGMYERKEKATDKSKVLFVVVLDEKILFLSHSEYTDYTTLESTTTRIIYSRKFITQQ